MAGVETRCKLGIPIDLIAAQEGEIDTRVCRRHYIGELRLRPIFVVADIHISVGIEQQSGIGRGIDAGDVTDVVTVLLQPIDRGIFFAKQEVLWPGLVGRGIHVDRAIVADRIGAVVLTAGALIQIISAPGIIGFPSRVAGLEQKIRSGAVVAHYERNHVLEITSIRRQLGEVDPRHGGAESVTDQFPASTVLVASLKIGFG